MALTAITPIPKRVTPLRHPFGAALPVAGHGAIIASGSVPTSTRQNPQARRMTDATALPAVLPPRPHEIFRRRASRLRELSQGHTLAPFLIILSRLFHVQDRIRPRHLAALPMPLTASNLPEGVFEAVLRQLLEVAGEVALDEGLERARVDLLEASGDARRSLSAMVFRAEFSAIDAGACLYVALALQACLAPVAARQVPDTSHSALGRTCPCCGSKPLASVISSGPAERSRYCCCSFCGTLWPYLRATCAICGDPAAVSYCYV
jgi:FdhE protein